MFGELAGQKGMLPVDFIDSNPDSLPPYKKEEKKQPQPPPEVRRIELICVVYSNVRIQAVVSETIIIIVFPSAPAGHWQV